MVDMAEAKQVKRKKIGLGVDTIAEDIEHHARILQEAGHVKEATNLQEWARELREKKVRKPY